MLAHILNQKMMIILYKKIGSEGIGEKPEKIGDKRLYMCIGTPSVWFGHARDDILKWWLSIVLENGQKWINQIEKKLLQNKEASLFPSFLLV